MSRARGTAVGAVGAVVATLVLLPVAIAVQPAFDLRDDLVSGLAARGSTAPLLGQAVIAALALAHGALAVTLWVRRWRVAAAAAAVGAVCLLGIALVQISCPNGARGCSGPDSGRPAVKPIEDVLHRDLVAAFEVASVLGALMVGVRLRHTWAGRSLLAAAVLSPVLLWRQQAGVDIGWWQLAWLLVTCTLVLLQTGAAGHRAARAEAGRQRPL